MSVRYYKDTEYANVIYKSQNGEWYVRYYTWFDWDRLYATPPDETICAWKEITEAEAFTICL